MSEISTDKAKDIQNAVALLKKGDVIGLPTETVYGLAGDVFNESAVHKIFAIKQRPFFDPLIVHVAAIEDVNKLVENVPEGARVLMRAFWPGPLTLILPKKKVVSDLVTSGLTTVGVRWPNHPVAQAVIREFGSPLAAPSANLFGRTSPTTAKHVRDEFGGAVTVIDGGPCAVGLESTVVSVTTRETGTEVLIHRPGAVTAQMIRAAFLRAGQTADVREQESEVAPGHLKHHYMPKIPLIIVPEAFAIEGGAATLTDKLKLPAWRPVELKLHPQPELAARKLYSDLRDIEMSGATLIYVRRPYVIPSELWAAVWNRLEKAASHDLSRSLAN